MRLPIAHVDAFADAPFRGNPAAVCLLPAAREQPWMAAVAGEMNLSETAFLVPRADGSYNLRWFTPTVEVALCGHATLASAHVLWERGLLAPDAVARFHTKSGLLTATRAPDGFIELDFPARPSTPMDVPDGLAEALGERVLHVGRSADDELVELASEAAVRRLKPDIERLAALPVRGVMVTARAAEGLSISSRASSRPPPASTRIRSRAPPTAVSAPFWGNRLGKTEMLAYQASARGGVVRVVLRGDRVGLGGRALTVLDGELRV